MCLIAIAWDCHPRYRLVLVANRDEYHARSAAPAERDPRHPDVFGGRDLQQGGSWLMASTRGRLAAVTNVRSGGDGGLRPRSRGDLVRGFAAADDDAAGFLDALQRDACQYGRFNLLLWDGRQLAFASNHPGYSQALVSPGIHAMSNGAFDAPWPKSQHATRALSAWLDERHGASGSAAAGEVAPLLAALGDAGQAPDHLLPDTGVGIELERVMSPPFVRGPVYGTRCSTVVLVEETSITFVERRYDADARTTGETFEVLKRSLPAGSP